MNTSYIGILMFDFPVTTAKERKEYALFRKELIKLGYYQLQNSIYIVNYTNKEKIINIEEQLLKFINAGSSVRSLILTEKQFNKMSILSGDLTFGEKILQKENRILEY